MVRQLSFRFTSTRLGLVIGLLVISFFMAVARATAVESICPGGATPRADIVWCADFENQTGCLTGTEVACWQNDGYLTTPNPNNDAYGWKKVTASGTGQSAAVGSGYARALLPPGTVGPGLVDRETIQQGPNTKFTDIRYRFYVRYGRGYISMPSGHAFQAVAYSDDFRCAGAVKWQSSTFSNEVHYDGVAGCGPGLDSLTLAPNLTRIPILNNRWYMVEVRMKLDTTCSNASTTPWSGCNGEVQAWVDGVQTHNYTGLNLGRQQGAAQGHSNLAFYQMFLPLNYFHYGLPPWDNTMDVDNVVVSNNGTLTIGPAPGENPRGTGDTSSPYAAIGPYWAFLGRHAGGDFTTEGYIGQYNSTKYRSGASLDPTRFHGTFTNQGAVAIGDIPGLIVAPPQVNTLYTVRDGTNASNGVVCGSDGTGSTQRNCMYDGANWIYTSNTDNSMKVHITGSSDGGGVYHERQSGIAFPTWATHGWVYLPSTNNYAVSNLALSGFQDNSFGPGNYVAFTVSGTSCANLKWAVTQRTAGTVSTLPTGTAATCDAWHEYELMIYSTGAVSLMIDRARILNQQPLQLSAAWAFATGGAYNEPFPIVGVVDFQGMPPFDVWYDDVTIASPSAWSCDGWGPPSCPFGSGGAGPGPVAPAGVVVK